MEILSDKYLAKYRTLADKKISGKFKKLNLISKVESAENNFDFYLESSAVFSSAIEGNSIDLNTFMNSKQSKKKLAGKEYLEILDLIKAYKLAKESELNEKNFLKAHKIMSEQFLIKSKLGKYREEKIGVFDAGGLVYVAIEPDKVVEEMYKLFKDIKELKKRDLNLEETFYYASMIHLIFVHIHPFMDGNGRSARLLEKWFLSEKLGEIAWKIPSENYYFENRKDYYKNINLGPDYYSLNYAKCVLFLQMLVKSIN
ncbi:MAG: Fic family protein [Ignavibacteriae bacterium]|nr:Fic family protein [Ignavibacteriota bacterium]